MSDIALHPFYEDPEGTIHVPGKDELLEGMVEVKRVLIVNELRKEICFEKESHDSVEFPLTDEGRKNALLKFESLRIIKRFKDKPINELYLVESHHEYSEGYWIETEVKVLAEEDFVIKQWKQKENTR